MMNSRAFALANAAVYGLTMLGLAFLAMAIPGARRAVDQTAEYYPGFAATPRGALVGAGYGIVTGLIIGWITALF